jgi:prevent-host-death family protein
MAIDVMTINDYLMTMKNVGIAELKAHLSRYLKEVRKGHSVIVMDRTEPIARVEPYTRSSHALKVRAPLHDLHHIELPPPLGNPPASTAALSDERQDRE